MNVIRKAMKMKDIMKEIKNEDDMHAAIIAEHISEMSDAAVLSFICASVLTLVNRSEGKVRPTEVLASAARCIDESGVK